MRRLACCFALHLFLAAAVSGASYYVDPGAGAADNPGTRERPWRTLEEVFRQKRAFEPGDVILLAGGHHGDVTVSGVNEGHVRIEALPGEEPRLSRLRLRDARHWRIKGLTISPEFADRFVRRTLVETDENSRDIVILNCTLYSAADTSGWSAEEWVERSCMGFLIRGSSMRIVSNRLRNIDHGISVDGPTNIVENNLIENFSGDGIRALGDGCIIRRNVIRNCYDVDDNHDDGIQSWSVGPGGVGTGAVKNVIIDGNLIINYTDPNQKHRGTLQGIGCFDGFYEGWRITNNIILIDHWHGITLMGARDCQIVNNTVVDLNDERPGPCWIFIRNHKKGTPSTGNLIRNNIAPKFPTSAEAARSDHNVVLGDRGRFFVDFEALDLRLRPGSPAVDAGTAEAAPETDYLGHLRPHGDAVDAGAVEFYPPSQKSTNRFAEED